MSRADALRRSLHSTHVVLRLDSGRFVSPLETDGPAGRAVQACRNRNTWPVLAAEDDRAALGAAIVLPDYPSLAPERADPPVHGRTTLRDPDGGEPPEPAVPGEQAIDVDGVTYARGDRVRLRIEACRDVSDPFLDGRTATIERIVRDCLDRIHFGVTIEDDPGRDLFREAGRLLFFFPHEVRPEP